MMDIEQRSLFDYTLLDSDTQIFLQEQEAVLDCVLKRTAEEIGVILLRVKQRLPHGKYMPWLASRGMSESTAWRCMQIAQGKEIKKSFIMKDLNECAEIPQNAIEPPVKIVEDIPSVQPGRMNAPSHLMDLISSSKSPEWYTPSDLVARVVRLFGEIDVDPCSNSHDVPNVPAHRHYTVEDDGLRLPWQGRTYLNPPYGDEIPRWVGKLLGEYEAGRVSEAIALVPGRLDTAWFQPLYAYPMCYIRGRLRFVGAPHSAPFPSIAVYLGHRIDTFIEHFSPLGPIMKRIG